MILPSLPMVADTSPCEEYQYIHFTVAVYGSTLKYDVSNNGTIQPPHVDSAWIVGSDTTKFMFSTQAQSREPIDISCLERDFYILKILIGDCMMGRLFYTRGAPTSIVNPNSAEDIPATKICRDGQVLIERNGRTYTITGQQLLQPNSSFETLQERLL